MPALGPKPVTLGQLFGEEEAKRLAEEALRNHTYQAIVNGGGGKLGGLSALVAPTKGKSTMSTSASAPEPKRFLATEDVPQSDLRDMPKEEFARLERHVLHNLSARIVQDLIAAGQARFGNHRLPNHPVRRFTLEVDQMGVVAPPPPEPKQPSQMLLTAARSAGVDVGRRDAMAEVAGALVEVEAGLIPGADAGFVVLLLREKLGLNE